MSLQSWNNKLLTVHRTRTIKLWDLFLWQLTHCYKLMTSAYDQITVHDYLIELFD
jgi:hypothetical protein